MLPTVPVPSWPWFTWLAVGLVWVFLIGVWLALVVGCFRGIVQVLTSAWRGVAYVCGWLLGLPHTSGGSAHFATRRDVAQAGLLGDTGLPLASYGRDGTLREPHGGHVCVMGPPRSWKSTGIIMPALAQYPGSVVVNDLRGELYERTAAARETYGPCFCFAPTRVASHAVNILDLVRWDTEAQFGDTHRIVHHLLSPPERQAAPNPFTEPAIPVLRAIVTHCHDLGQGHFPGVVRWMLAPEKSLKEKTDEVLASPNPLVSSGARRLADMSDRLRASVWNAALTPLAPFEDPTIAAHTSHSDLQFTMLTQGLQPASLYLCPSFSDVRRLSGFLGAFIEALVAVLGSPTQTPRHKVLLVLDEQANLGYLPELEKAISYLQGSGTQVLAAFQNIAQVAQTYGPESPLLASFATQVHFRPHDQATAEHIAGLLGTATVARHSASATVGLLGTWKSSRSEAEAERPLMTVDEILRLPQTAALVIQSGAPPVMARKQSVPAPTAAEKARTLVATHRQGCAVAACVLVVLAGLWPALAPIWQPALRPVVAGESVAHASLVPGPDVTAAPPPPQGTDDRALTSPSSAPAPTLPWKLLYATTSGPTWTTGGTEHGKAAPPPAPQLKDSAATEGACQEALSVRYGPKMTELHTINAAYKQTPSGKSPAIGTLERTPSRYTWELGFAGSRTTHTAWCEETDLSQYQVGMFGALRRK